MASVNRRRFLQGAGAASAIGLAGCLGFGGGGGSDTVKVGMIEALSGAFAAPGNRRLWATKAAVDKVNEEGGLNGREIELLVRDSAATPGTATTKVRSLINEEDIELLVGTFSSSVCLALAPIVTRNQIPYSAGYCATRTLTGENCRSFAFRGTRSNAAIQWAGLGPYMYDEWGIESASILYADYSWGQSELHYFKKYFDGEVRSEIGVPAGTSDFSQYLSKVDESADALVFIQAGGDAINLLKDVGSFDTHREFEKGLVTVGAGVGGFLEDGGVGEEVANSLRGINYYPKVLSGPLDTEANRQFHEKYAEYADEPRPTRSSSTGWEAIHVMQKIAEEIDYTGPDQAQEFVDTWRGLEMDQSYAFPQGDKYYRSDNQCILEQYIFNNDGYTEEITDTIPLEVAGDTPNTCDFPDGSGNG